MLKYGAWIHTGGSCSLEEQVMRAKECGITSLRSYTIQYSEKAAPILKEAGMSLYGGMHVNAEALIEDWHSQVHLDDLGKYAQFDIPIEAVCVGNELRQFGDHPDKKEFTARVSYALARVLDTYRDWMAQHGVKLTLTYAMEGIVFNQHGVFHEHVWPLVDACDVISINLYPMGRNAWHGPTQFDESRLFLYDPRTQNNRLLKFELQLRNVMEQLQSLRKPLMLSETGFPSAVGYTHIQDGLILPVNDCQQYQQVMKRFLKIIAGANNDYENILQALYFYEWRDNLYHSKINNVEQSPIHCAFGLCDHLGNPKFDILELLRADEKQGYTS